MSPERLELLSDLATTPRLAIAKQTRVSFYARHDGKLDRYVDGNRHSVVTPEVVEKTLLRLQRDLRSSLGPMQARLDSIDDYLAVVSAFEAQAEEEEREQGKQGD